MRRSFRLAVYSRKRKRGGEEMSANRIFGIDLARTLAMYLVVVFHVVGILSGYDKLNATGRFLSAATICCVDLFALISGYVGVDSKFRFSRFANLWVQVVVTGAVIVAGGWALGLFHPTLKDWGKVFLPVTSHAYWYVTAYFFLFLLMPFLNAGLATIPRRVLNRIVGVLLALVVCIPAFNPFGSDTYLLGGGLSTAWLVICYIVGAWLRGIRFGNARFWLVCVAVMTVVSYKFGGAYSHPVTLLLAVCWLMMCARIDCHHEGIRNGVGFLSSCAFGVYVWHGQPLLHKTMQNCFSFVSHYNPLVAALMILGISGALYLAISVLEFARMRVFEFLKLKAIVGKICEKGGLS